MPGCDGRTLCPDGPPAETGDLDKTEYTVVTRKDGRLEATTRSVKFTIVKPGESLIDDAAGAPPAAAQKS